MKYEYTVDEEYPVGAVAFESSWTTYNAAMIANDAAVLR